MWTRFFALAMILVAGFATYLIRLDDLTVRDSFILGFTLGGTTVFLVAVGYRIMAGPFQPRR